MPNFSLAPALDVLCTGSYPRLPSCIRDNIVPPSPLTGPEADAALSLLTVAIRRRLLCEQIPPQMTVRSLEKGIVVFEIPHEFRLSLSVVGDDLKLPWRLVNLEVLVGVGLPGGPPLCHSQQTRYLTQLAQSHLVAAEYPLTHVFTLLHTFCLSLVLDCLHTQAGLMSSMAAGGHVRVDEYQVGQLLRLGYWLPSTLSPLPASVAQMVPRLQITVDPSSPSHPITTTHSPPLPAGTTAQLSLGNLCLEKVVGRCVRARSSAKLQLLRDSLKNTVWETRAVLSSEPLCLRVSVPVRGGHCEVVIGVDVRTGTMGVAVEPGAGGEGVEREVGEMERGIGQPGSYLPGHLSRLQCQLFFDRVTACAKELSLAVSPSLPFPSPLPLPSPHLLFVQLLPLAYLVVCAVESSGVVAPRYYLLEVVETNGGGQGVDEGRMPPVPRIFYSPVTLAELDDAQLVEDSLRAVTVRSSPAVVKRKLQEDSHGLPSTKRVCVMSSHVGFSALPSLCSSRLLLAQIKTSLKMSGIRGYQELWPEHMCPCVSVCQFPLLPGQSRDVHRHLSSLFLSCLIFPAPSGHKLVMVFSPLIPASQAPDVVLHHHLPLGTDLGPSLLADWESKLALLSMALELLHYLEDPLWPLASSSRLSHFGYDSLTVSYGEHSLSLHGGMSGLQLSFSLESPHVFLTAHLQQTLLATLSLPVLLKGVVGTEETLTLLHKFTDSFPGASLVPLSAAQIQLQYNSLYPPRSLRVIFGV
ncbi:Mediator of RNA polymerase II transcription subunit 14 [Geodia barretti]|uniref:Mediator of RNA polymerase II transcription subunit 14 n=1 Tax=Geodia barretti TaxID=519541 RepID=A0AA35W9Y0_GEOBA|nr:Mediator of RNA polymerase II transcription subunit 14 [Geodia barretti]